jgi:hypothetical protein
MREGLLALVAAAGLGYAADDGYIEPERCADCHRQIAQSYARTGMGRSFRTVGPESVLPGFAPGTFSHGASGQSFHAYRKDGRFYLRRDSDDGSLESEIHYVIGSGNHARTYLHRTAGGALIELPLTWYAGGWAMSPAYDRPDHAGFSRPIAYACMFCHNAYPQLETGVEDWEGGTRFPQRLPQGIDCQRCHGPGREHARTARRDTIVNPARLSTDRQLEICMQCHLETTSLALPSMLRRAGRGVFSYRPGEPLADYMLHFDHAPGAGREDKFELVSAVYRLRKSACFRASAGALTCTTCHDPHGAPRNYVDTCNQCHTTLSARHQPAQECVSCHMPRRRAADAIHITVTDHYIRARPAAAADTVEQHDGNSPPYSGEVVLYYPASLPHTGENQIDMAIAQVKQDSNPAGGLRRLEQLIAQYKPTRGDAYFELGEALVRAGQRARAIPYFEEAVKREPKQWRYLGALGTVQALERARGLAPKEVVLIYALADLYSKEGKLPQAIALLRQARELEPERVEGANNLGTALLKMGDLSGAEAVLREAVRLRPELAATHLNLGLTLAAAGKADEARVHLRKAEAK